MGHRSQAPLKRGKIDKITLFKEGLEGGFNEIGFVLDLF